MKQLLKIIILLFPLTLWSFPNVGDKVEFHSTDGDFVLIREILDYSIEDNTYLYQEIFLKENETVYINQEWRLNAFFMTKAKVDNVHKSCVKNGGVLEDVSSHAGNFFVCSFFEEGVDKIFSIGYVPFGTVLFSTYIDGDVYDFELFKVNFGQ